MKKFNILLASLLLLALYLTACGSSSIVGTWTVKEYIYEDETISPDTAAEWFGESFAKNNDTKLVFQNSGHVKAQFPMTGLDTTLDYTVTDNLIEVYEEGHSEYLTIEGDKILIELQDNLYMVLKK